MRQKELALPSIGPKLTEIYNDQNINVWSATRIEHPVCWLKMWIYLKVPYERLGFIYKYHMND